MVDHAQQELDVCFSPVDVLQDGGISAVDIQKLKVSSSLLQTLLPEY